MTLEDDHGHSATVYAPGYAVGYAGWLEWQIDYSEFDGVDMSEIVQLSVGVGDPSDPLHGEGLVYIDNISYGHSLEESE